MFVLFRIPVLQRVAVGFRCSSPVATCLLLITVGCEASKSLPIHSERGPKDEAAIIQFCADCHNLPDPLSFDKTRWHEEVAQGIRIYRKSGRTDLVIPDFEATLSFFARTAPDKIEIQPPLRTEDRRFRRTDLAWPDHAKLISTSHVKSSFDGKAIRLLIADMWSGSIVEAVHEQEWVQAHTRGLVAHPAHVESADLNQDGIEDFLIADLGMISPQAENQAGVWWLRGEADGTLTRLPIKLGLSRVADARVIDYDGDGDSDLIVGDFGLHFVGSIYWGENVEIQDGIPQYQWHVVDPRPGVISLPVIDYDHDGDQDFFALISQQYETIELHLNQGNGRFERQTVYSPSDPASGSSSMQVVDFDGDGDLDVIYTNGDTFDDQLAKPTHAIRWLENQGSFPFKVHLVGLMPGCYHATAGKIDSDERMDIAAVAYLDPVEVARYPQGTFDGVVWFRQLADGSFLRHSLEQDVCQATSCQLLDWDRDGDLDLFVPPSSSDPSQSLPVKLFTNRGSQEETPP